jgi:hypothetical protein
MQRTHTMALGGEDAWNVGVPRKQKQEITEGNRTERESAILIGSNHFFPVIKHAVVIVHMQCTFRLINNKLSYVYCIQFHANISV